VDIDVLHLFEGTNSDPTSPKLRAITTNDKKQTNIFLSMVQQEWDRRKPSQRINLLVEKSKLPDDQLHQGKLHCLWEKIVGEIGSVISSAERELTTQNRNINGHQRLRVQWQQSAIGKHAGITLSMAGHQNRNSPLRLPNYESQMMGLMMWSY
jgi:hypothetical protein